MNEQGLKALENLGAELGAAKAENERLRGLLRECAGQIDLLIEVYVEDDVEPEDIAISEQIKADIHAALSQQADPCVFHDSDREACQQYSGQVPCEPAPAQDEREAFREFHLKEFGCEPQIDDSSAEFRLTHANRWKVWLARATRPAQTEQQPVALPPFAAQVLEKLERVDECFSDGQGADIGREWFDVLTLLGLLKREQRSPALWSITQQGRDALAAPIAQAAPQPEQSELIKALEELLAGTGTSPGANKRYGKARAALDAYRAALSAQGQKP